MHETAGAFFKPQKEQKTEMKEMKKNYHHITKYRNFSNKGNKSSTEFFAKKTSPTAFNVVYDTEYLYNENLKLKNVLNKKTNLINELKFNNLKLNDINNKSYKNFEDILSKGNNTKSNFFNNKTEGDEIDDMTMRGEKFNTYTTEENMEDRMLNTESGFRYTNQLGEMNRKAKESFMINGLKKQLLTYRHQIKSLEEENERIKATSKCTKYSELEGSYNKLSNEHYILKEEMERLKVAYQDKEIKLKITTEERDNYKGSFLKVKDKFEESHENSIKYQEESLFAKEKVKLLEEKVRNLEFKLTSYKSTFKDKDNQIEDFKKDVVLLETYKKDRPQLEKRLTSYYIKTCSLKDENEKKSCRMREIEINSTKLQVETEQKIKQYNKKFKDMEEKIKTLKLEKDNLIKEKEDLIKKNEEQEKKIEELNQDINNKNDLLEEETRKAEETDRKITNLNKDKDKLNSKIETDSEKMKGLQAEKEKLQEDVKVLEEQVKSQIEPEKQEEQPQS